MKKIIALVILSFVIPVASFSQDSLVSQIASKNFAKFSVHNNTFSGIGWDTLVNKIKVSDFVLIGEEHLTSEIPSFFEAITTEVKFDNFFCEIDPYSAKIIESKIKNLSENELSKYINKFGNVFSFYALEPEFDLLKKFVKSNTNIYGLDQIPFMTDRLISNDLKQKTKSKEAQKIYEHIELKSIEGFQKFVKDPANLDYPYLFSDDFSKQVSNLKKLSLSQNENEIIKDIELTLKIYKEEDHYLRVSLNKSNLMREYGKWENKKNLFKFGAWHLFKFEDIGNLVSNIADSKFKKSLHIMVIGKSGSNAPPLNGMPNAETVVDEHEVVNLSFKPLLSVVPDGDVDWYCLNLAPIKIALEEGKLNITDQDLIKVINGYDYIVIIPKVTAPKFIQNLK